MNKCIYKMIFPLLILLFSCCQDIQIPKYRFPAIEVNENIIFLRDCSYGNTGGILAVDTSSDKIIYRYKFGGTGLTNAVYNSQISDNIFILLDYEHYFFVLDPVTGIVKNHYVDYRISDLILAENKVIIKKNVISYKGQSVKCKYYNQLTNKLEDFTVPEGEIGARIDQNIIINNKSYLPVYYDNEGNADNRYPTIYNITDNKIIDFFPDRDYAFFHFVSSEHIYAYHKQLYHDEELYIADIYKVDSFEPTVAYTIFSYEESDDEPIGLRIFEDDDCLYVIDQPRDCQRITKRKKSDYSIASQKVITTNYEGGVVPYFKNNHFWLTSREDEGAYKISKDLEITVVK